MRQHYQYREVAWPWTFRLTRLLYTRSWISNERPGLLFDLATGWLMQHRIIPRSHYADPVDFRGKGKGDVAPVEQTGTDTVSRTAFTAGDAAGAN
ncbi:hypothetical protein [Klebsiella pneumoniae]|uniref:hypothetical protein n=1 Tax=Klebsiella pneumoniae TaxID=573 RepID=UPI00350FA8DE